MKTVIVQRKLILILGLTIVINKYFNRRTLESYSYG